MRFSRRTSKLSMTSHFEFPFSHHFLSFNRSFNAIHLQISLKNLQLPSSPFTIHFAFCAFPVHHPWVAHFLLVGKNCIKRNEENENARRTNSLKWPYGFMLLINGIMTFWTSSRFSSMRFLMEINCKRFQRGQL